jgi:hypothetical protein
MTEQHEDFLNGLHIVEYELERVIGELDDMQDRHSIPALDRVSLDPLQWALNKLSDDLHDANVEIRNARPYEASAKREADTAQQQQQDEQLQSLSIVNGLRAELQTVKAERDLANGQHAIAVRKYNAEVERRLALEKQVAQVTAERDDLKKQSTQINPTLHQLIEAFEGSTPAEILQKLLLLDGKGFQLSQEAGELPAESTPEPDRWQEGDEVFNEASGILIVEEAHFDLVRLSGRQQFQRQEDLQRVGWKLYRKASALGVQQLTPRHVDLPDMPPLTPQQVAEFAAVTEPIDDSVGANGEGQS